MKEPLHKLSIYVLPENHIKLKVYCAEQSISMNSFVDICVRYGLMYPSLINQFIMEEEERKKKEK